MFAILGAGFSFIAWLSTFGIGRTQYQVGNPVKELQSLAAYLLPLVIFVTWGLGFLRQLVPTDPANALVILGAKLAVFVVVPAALMHARFGYNTRTVVAVSASPRHLLAALGMSACCSSFSLCWGVGGGTSLPHTFLEL